MRSIDRLEQRLVAQSGLLRQIASLLERLSTQDAASSQRDTRLHGDTPPVVLTQDRPFVTVLESPIPLPVAMPEYPHFVAFLTGTAMTAGATHPLKVIRNDAEQAVAIREIALYRLTAPPPDVYGVITVSVQRVQYPSGGVSVDTGGVRVARLDSQTAPPLVVSLIPSVAPSQSEVLSIALVPIGNAPAEHYVSQLLETTGYPLWDPRERPPIVVAPTETVGIFLEGDTALWDGTSFLVRIGMSVLGT